jgi:tellurite resistance protein TehA-like permease
MLVLFIVGIAGVLFLLTYAIYYMNKYYKLEEMYNDLVDEYNSGVFLTLDEEE